MLKIQRVTNGETVFKVIGRMDVANVKALKQVIQAEAKGRRVVLELRDLVLVDRAAVKFLERCETDSIELRNCPAYIREWITREREGS
jgi:anti-anti-sigma regulatory factor